MESFRVKFSWNDISRAMDLFISLNLLLIIGLPVVSSIDCPSDPLELTMETGRCSIDLEEHEGKALKGGLSDTNKREACRIYKDSIVCIEDIVNACQRQNSHILSHAEVVLKDHKDGFGKLCEDEQHFQNYLQHANCYRDHSSDTLSCLNKFDQDLESDPTYDEDNYEEPNLCIFISDLKKCIRDALLESCGSDAVDMFIKLCKHKVPQELYSTCFTTPAPPPEETETDAATPGPSQQFGIVISVSALITFINISQYIRN